MKLFTFRNFILGIFIAIGLFIGLNCYSSASTVKSINLKHGSSFPSNTNYQTQVTFSSSPSFSIDTYIDVTNPNTSHTYPYYCNLHVTTSNGDYIIKSTKGTFTANDHSTVTNNLGMASAGTYNLPGYFINSYLEYSCGYLDDGYGNIYVSSTGSTVNPAYVGTYNTNNYLSNFDITSVNSNYVSFTNSILSNDNNYPITTFVSDSFYAHYSAIDNYYLDSNNSVYLSGGTIAFQNFTLNNNIFDYITINMHVICENGNDSIIGTYNADYNTFTSLSSSSVIFNFTNKNITLTSCPVVWYYEYTVYGSYDPVITSFYSPFRNAYFSRVALNPLNVYDTREAADWDTIENSEELENLDKTSVSMNEIISDNNDTFNGDFSDYDDYVSRVDLNGSKYSFNQITQQPRMYLNAFYNGLPSSIQDFIKIILNIGLAMMVLTVGTRVIRHRS